ncbi:MAG: DUF2530 domain-containing protein [Pseudonocardiales bacterium]|nr:MAG: DUF2530 domain-containing protein [Pseudonocardiales bacterium]
MHPVVPPLPRNLADPRPVVGVGTVIWFAAAVVLLIASESIVWVWACLTGGLLGLIGFAMIHWQGRAARCGARGAPRDLF